MLGKTEILSKITYLALYTSIPSYVKAYGHTTSVHFTLNNVSLKSVFDTGKQNSIRLFKVSSLNESLTELNKENIYRVNIIVHQLLQIILVLHLHSKVI